MLNIYVPNTRELTFVKETLLKLKSHIKSRMLILRNVNTPLTPLNRSARQKLNREIREQIDVMTHRDLTDIYRTFHQNTKYTFFSAPHRPI